MENDKVVEELKEAYRDVFSTVKGKLVLQDILLSGCMERSAFSQEPLIMAANCGVQDFVRKLHKMTLPISDKTDKPTKAKK